MNKLQSLIKRYEFIKNNWLKSAGTSEQATLESQLEQIIKEMETYKQSHGLDARMTPAEKVVALYALYKESSDGASKRKE